MIKEAVKQLYDLSLSPESKITNKLITYRILPWVKYSSSVGNCHCSKCYYC